MRRRDAHFFFLASFLGLTLALAALPAMGGGVAILSTVLSDNGDDDGFADTRETVSMQLTVQNTSGAVLSGVWANIETRDAHLVCPTQPSIFIGTLMPGEVKLTTEAFEFRVTEVDRAALGLGPYDELSATFDVSVEAFPPTEAFPAQITLNLDLNAGPGAGPTTFFESFEGSLGAFEVDNLDATLHGPVVADGARCQYHDPDWIYSYIYNNPDYTDICYPGVSPLHADAIWWGLSGPGISLADDGRAYTGQHSLYWGLDMGLPDGFTYPLAALEAVRTTEPIALATEVDPVLSFKHQVLTWAWCAYHEARDRAVVMAQRADEAGNPVGPWIKIYPYQNPYESPVDHAILACTFDPVDDGSTEDDFFEPWDPERQFGTSSTCYPEMVYSVQGDTDGPFDPANVEYADGPGLEGAWGEGTWVESKFDLGRFRGGRVRLRFLTSSLKTAGLPETLFDLSPGHPGRGWWIDDVTVEGALETAAVLTVDTAPNGSLPVLPDGDLDGSPDLCDNCVNLPNPDQADWDYDGVGNDCDPCIFDPDNDVDLDDVCGDMDNCPGAWNPDQEDADGDTFGDACDTCPDYPNPTQQDHDEDGAGDHCDCAFDDPTTYPGAPEANDGVDNQCPGDPGYGMVDEISGSFGFFDPADPTVLSWPAQEGAQLYQVIRSDTADFASGCTLFPAASATTFVDASVPPAGGHAYLVRATRPHLGSWGGDSTGAERSVPCN